MKILIAVGEFHRGAGYPRYGVETARALASRGHHVTVLTRRVASEDRDERLAFRTYAVPERSALATMAAEPYVVTREMRRLSRDFDVMLSIGIPVLAPAVMVGLGTQRGFFEASRRALPAGSPRRLIEQVRPFHRVVMAWERAMLRGRHPALVIAGGERYAEEYPRHFGFPRERVAVVPMGVEPGGFAFDAALRARTRAELGIPDGTTMMLHVGNRARQKGVDVLADALAMLEAGPWHFVFAGGGSRSGAIQSRTRELRARGLVSLLGRVPSVHALYCAADLVVFPSRYDPWGLVVTEALACGTPVVCSSTIGSAVAVREGENGWLLADPSDPAEIVRAITRMRAATGTLDRARIAGSVRWLSWEAGAERLESHLEAVAASRGARA